VNRDAGIGEACFDADSYLLCDSVRGVNRHLRVNHHVKLHITKRTGLTCTKLVKHRRPSQPLPIDILCMCWIGSPNP